MNELRWPTVTVCRMRNALLGLSLCCLGCGPIQYTTNLIAAESAIEAARDDNARWHAPYEFYSAEAFLEKAREESAQGQYEDAVRFADAAVSYGQRASQLARKRAKKGGR